MKNNIFIPKQLHVGFQKRSDTYTGKLSYIIYSDRKGIKRKETSWEKWRDKTIDTLDITNEPTEGFVLNKNVGGVSGRHSWNMRTEKVRIYHPKGFEFEITIPNLLYILENTSAIKGKGISGLMVLGWDKDSLVLIPESAPEFEQMVSFTELQSGKVTKKELVPGQIYITAQNEEIVFLKEALSYNYSGIASGKKLFFGNSTQPAYNRTFIKTIESLKAITDKKADAETFNSLLDSLDNNTFYKPVSLKSREHVLVDFAYLQKCVDSYYTDELMYKKKKVKIKTTSSWEKDKFKKYQVLNSKREVIQDFNTIQEMLDTKLFTIEEIKDVSDYQYLVAEDLTKENFNDRIRYISKGSSYVRISYSCQGWSNPQKDFYLYEYDNRQHHDYKKLYNTFEELLADNIFYNRIITNLPN